MKYISSLLTHWAGRSLPDDESRYGLLVDKIVRGQELLFSFNPIPFSSKYGGFRNKNTWGVHMVCFTDMPLSMSSQHANKYSRFGIAFEKAPLANCCVAPVAYALNPFIYEAYSYLYHVAVGLKPAIEGMTLADGAHVGQIFSFNKYMQRLHHFLAWTQDYSEKEFPYREDTLLAASGQAEFFQDTAAYYYEREWRAVYRLGDRYPWVAAHDGEVYFRFDGSSIRYLILPKAMCPRAESDLRALYHSAKPPEVVPFEELDTGSWDR